MAKRIRFYNGYENNKICEGFLEKDPMFEGGYKVVYKNMSLSITSIKILKDDK
jgi:hypothetical protein